MSLTKIPATVITGFLGAGKTTLVRHLLEHALDHLNEQGVLLLEIGNEREHFERAFPTLLAYWPETTAGEGPVLLLTRDALAGWQATQDIQ